MCEISPNQVTLSASRPPDIPHGENLPLLCAKFLSSFQVFKFSSFAKKPFFADSSSEVAACLCGPEVAAKQGDPTGRIFAIEVPANFVRICSETIQAVLF
jgi:hypothetical protein